MILADFGTIPDWLYHLLQMIADSIVSALKSLFGWVSDVLASFLLTIIAHLPTIPTLDWSPITTYLDYIDAFVPVVAALTALGAYLAWWLAWSIFRIVAKLIWSG